MHCGWRDGGHAATSEHWHPIDFQGRATAGRCFDADADRCREGHSAGGRYSALIPSGMYEGLVSPPALATSRKSREE